MSARRKFSHRLTMTVLAWIVGLLIFFPILWTVLTSFKSELDAFAIPPKFLFFHWTLENYGVVQERSNYIGAATNSILLSIGANLVGLAIAVPAAWSMAFAPTVAIDRRQTHVMYAIMLAGIAVTVLIAWLTSFPLFTSWWGYVLLAVIVGLPVISWIMTRRTTDVLMWMLSTKMMPGVGVLVPIYLLYRDYHLIDTRLGVGFLLMMVNLPIIIWMLYTYFKEIPVDILEAARMDGASLLNEIIHVLTPMATPGHRLDDAVVGDPVVERGVLDAAADDDARRAADLPDRRIFEPRRPVLGQAVGGLDSRDRPDHHPRLVLAEAIGARPDFRRRQVIRI